MGFLTVLIDLMLVLTGAAFFGFPVGRAYERGFQTATAAEKEFSAYAGADGGEILNEAEFIFPEYIGD